ncbi:MAG: hypothetical protein B6D61_02375 [Bacteroidetes bacterium 4484_249]|nr:MAG: hypothetical protein B6D61_02375 [Bacteroidetes bacterium 4484_249]
MKIEIFLRSFLALLFFPLVALQSQVDITLDDLEYQNGEYYNMYSRDGSQWIVTGLTGQIGGPHTWDFSTGPTDSDYAFDYVLPTTTPCNSDFPLSTITEVKTGGADPAYMYMDFQIGVGRMNYGYCQPALSPLSAVFAPPLIDFPSTISFTDNWTGNTTFQIESGAYIFDINYDFTAFCNAWGTLTLPNGHGDSCLQVNYLEHYEIWWSGIMLQESYIRTFYWIIPDAGIAVIISSEEGTTPPPEDFDYSNVYSRMYESSKFPTPREWTGAIDNNWSLAGNWIPNGIPGIEDDITIPSEPENQPIVNSGADCHNLVLESGASLTIQSDASGTGSLITTGNITNNGTITVQRYFSGNDMDWHLVSSPVTDATAGVFTDMYLQRFDEADDQYYEITDPTHQLTVMYGYGLYSTLGANNSVSFNGTLNTGIQSMACKPNGQGWFLLGNPYPSSINWEAVTIPTGISNEVHYIEAATGADLSYVQGTGGTGSQFVPPMQGFFVKAFSQATLTIDDNVRSHSGAGNFYKSNPENLLVLQAAGNDFINDTWIHFNENAGVEHDGQFDAYKRITESNPELPQIYSITPTGEKLSVNGLPETESVSVGFIAGTSGVYTISAIKTDFPIVILEDLLTGYKTDLLNNSYSFNHNQGNTEERFIVHFTPLAVPENGFAQFNIFSVNNQIHINGVEEGEVIVYNTMGQQIYSGQVKPVIDINGHKPGAFIVKVISGKNVITRKVMLNTTK